MFPLNTLRRRPGDRVAARPPAADHEALAAEYDQEAAAARKEAAKHREMAAAYAAGVAYGKVGHSGKGSMKLHCERLAEHYESLAKEADSLAALHPLNEKLQYQRMLALYRSGQVADSLQSYRGFYSALMDQVGIEPSTQLRELQEAILLSLPALSEPFPSEETRKVVSEQIRRSP